MGRSKTTRGWRWAESEPNKTAPKHLINIGTLELGTFTTEDAPPYAILSHRWGADEISYEDYLDPEKRHGPGFEKVQNLCQFLQSPMVCDDDTEVQWVWIDTCCIDKRSSAELSEAINSMAMWYQHAVFCVVYMADVHPSEDRTVWEHQFQASEYWKRGWTLQEVLFPRSVVFCNSIWEKFFHLDAESEEAMTAISDITGIPSRCFENLENIFSESVARRMSWASRRQTARKEDEAYCLLGLFRITMPLVYGEGEHAFIRLQEEIIKQCDDESIFAWLDVDDYSDNSLYPMLACSPSMFRHSNNILCAEFHPRRPYQISNKGLEFETPAIEFWNNFHRRREMIIIQLNCCLAAQRSDCDNEDATPALQSPCMIALMRGIRRGYGSSYARVHPFDFGDKLWQYALSQKDTSRVSYIPKHTYFIALEKTRISHAGVWNAASRQMFEDLPTLEKRYLKLEAQAEREAGDKLEVLMKAPEIMTTAVRRAENGTGVIDRRNGSLKSHQGHVYPTIRINDDGRLF